MYDIDIGFLFISNTVLDILQKKKWGGGLLLDEIKAG
jgi:hypothetical protein